MEFEVSVNKGNDVLLVEILEELRATRELLERLVELLSASTIYTTASSEKAHSISVRSPSGLPEELRKRLTQNGVKIVEFRSITHRNSEEREQRHLAYFMGQHYRVSRLIIEPMRSTFQSPQVVTVDLTGLDENSLSVATNIGARLNNLGMLSLYEYVRNPKSLRLQVRCKPAAQSYLTGGWFEWYVAQVVQKTLNNNLQWIGRNVKCADEDGNQCEIDILFSLRTKKSVLVAIECKSADSLRQDDCQRVAKRRKMLGVDNSLIVLPSDIEISKSLQWEVTAGATVMSVEQLKSFLGTL